MDRASPRAMNIAAVRSSALAVAGKVAEALERDLLPLVVGATARSSSAPCWAGSGIAT